MKNPSEYLKMRVLGAIDMAEGNTQRERIKAVSRMTFTDEEGNPRQFTWRTIETWLVRYNKHGITALSSMPRSDKGKLGKVSMEEIMEAVRAVLPKFHDKRPKKTEVYRAAIEEGLLVRDRIAPNTFSRIVKEYEMLKPDEACKQKRRPAFAKAHANEINEELFFVEEDRVVKPDNTFPLKNVRFEAPRHLPNPKVQVRSQRPSPHQPKGPLIMIRSHFGLKHTPFDMQEPTFPPHQQTIFDTLLVHARQGGLCLVLGEPGTGKSVIKQTPIVHQPKRMVVPVVNRTLHTYWNTPRILRDAFEIEYQGRDHRCERLLVQEAFRLHRNGKMLVPIIDDAHLIPSESLRKPRLLLEDFPRTHNLVLIGQPTLMHALALSINEEIRSRATYSVVLDKLAPEDMEAFLLDQFDRVGLGHNTFTEDALALLVRSSEGLLRRARNLCLSALIEAVRDQTRTVDLKQINRVLTQPHWRKDYDIPSL